jgi:hypothetical protein
MRFSPMQLQNEILKTLLYYDIWSYPLRAKELFTFLPVNSMTLEQFNELLKSEATGNTILEHDGFYFVKGKTPLVVSDRQRREAHAKRMWLMARLSMHIIKRFPFVRAVFISGDLSKNATHSKSDVDFFIITEPNRLWITRSLLILFKKVFLLNSKKFFCLNYFATTENLTLEEQNIFQATEVATLKPLFNSTLFFRYLEANRWIKQYFPNFDVSLIPLPKTSERGSKIQRLFEVPFSFFSATKLDEHLMIKMEKIWAKRYPVFDEETRRRIFKCTRSESRAYVGNFEEKILALYQQRLRDFGVHS